MKPLGSTILRGITLAALLALANTAAFSRPDAPSRQSIAKAFPFLPAISQVRQVKDSDYYEIRIGKAELYYTNAKVSHLIHGTLIEANTDHNITRERLDELNVIAFESLNFNDAIKIVRGNGGNGQRTFASFEDPDCGFCKKLAATVQAMDNVTVYVFLYPILGTDSAEKSRNIWCSKNRHETYVAWMVHGVVPEKAQVAQCDTAAIERNKAFGQEHSIRGTPHLIFKSGRVVPGAVDADRLSRMLQ